MKKHNSDNIEKNTLTSRSLSLIRRFIRFLYNICYATGTRSEAVITKIAVILKAFFDIALSELFKGAGNFLFRMSEFKRSKFGRGEISLTRNIINLGTGIKDTFGICCEAFEREGIESGFAVIGRFITRGFKKFFRSRKTAINYLTPIAAVFVLGLTIYVWSNATFALSVTYGGTELGLVDSEETYRKASTAVEINVSDASDSNFKLDKTVNFKMVLAKKSDIQTVDQIYNNIVLKSCDGVKNGYGLYIDNRLAGACSENGAIEAMLTDMTKEYKNDSKVQSVGFSQKVSVKAGLFPEKVFKTASEIKNVVTGKSTATENTDGTSTLRSSGVFRISLDPLYAMNLSTDGNLDREDSIETVSSQPKLSVKVVKNEIYEKSIPYETTKTNSDKIYKGKTKVSVKGANGKEQILASVTYVDGVKTGETVIESKTLKEPVDEKILVGTKKKSRYGYYSDEGGSFGDAGGGNGSAVSIAARALGVRYRSGGTSFSGFDCSGLTQYVYRQLGINLPHSAAGQFAYGSSNGSRVSKSSLKAGDLVFFNTSGNRISHVGIYCGGGTFINASTSSYYRVKYDNINSAYWSSRYVAACRVS